jgi:hypothetical protein
LSIIIFAKNTDNALMLKPQKSNAGFSSWFGSAATPIPDEPVAIPLGLTKYNPAKFLLAFFLYPMRKMSTIKFAEKHCSPLTKFF